MKKITVLFGVLLTVIFASAQNNSLLSPDSALAFLKNNYPPEKVFLQTDKSWYFPGETIWMKAWCTLDGSPTYLSRILYVELVNDQGEVIRKKMYKLDSTSSTPADIDLPDGLKSGNYSINAYSLWMLNFPGFVYQRPIYIYNISDYKKTPAATTPPVKVQFFPEGGDIVIGGKNRVAFKAVNQNGLGVAITGTITDNTGKTISNITTEHDGMGVLEIEPEPGKTYTANVTTPAQNTFTIKLPATKEEGIGLRVENTSPSRLFVLLNRAEKNKERYSQLRMVAQMYQQIVFSATLNTDEGQLAAPIPKKNLPPGIMQITVFDAQNNPLAERLAFIENYKLVTPAINIDTLNTKAKGKNQVSFTLNAVTTPALSCLVSSETVSTAGLENNIAAAFLLTSDIKGYIHEPGYYFKNKEAPTLHHLDLLLMTQGWRRFEWKNILRKDFTALVYPVESAMSFGGTVTKSDSKQLVKEGRVSFIIKGEDSTSILAEAGITDKGEFLLNDVNYMKSAAVAYMGTNTKKENYIVDVKLRPTYIDTLKKSTRIPGINLDTTNLTTTIGNWVNDTTPFKNAKLLEGVVVKGKKQSREDSLNKQYAGGPFLLGKAIDPSSVKFARSIWQVIQQTVPGVTIEGNPFDPTVVINRFGALGGGDATASTGESDGSFSADVAVQTNGIAYYLNEVNVSKDVINTMSVDDVALIKVLKNEGAALGATQGVIAIYTKKGVAMGKTLYDKAYAVEKKEGYAVVKQFYSPDYAGNPDNKETDKRVTLYWNGRMAPARDGKYRFRFYNNDSSKRFRLIIQGIDKEGQLIYGEYPLAPPAGGE
jgi:hypothetical protein